MSFYKGSARWATISRKVRERAGWKCQVCNSPKNLCAHHRTYEHFGKEEDHLDDLTCLCQKCHELFHAKSKVIPRVRKPRRITKNTPLACFNDTLDQHIQAM